MDDYTIEILEECVRKNKQGAKMGRFKCHCGNEFETKLWIVVNKKIKSCGCLSWLKYLGCTEHERGIRTLYTQYRNQAKRKNRVIDFEITLEEFTEITKDCCHYCNAPPRERSTYGKQKVYASGIDRRDDSLGYTIDNCTPCCTVCNMMKKSMGDAEFIDHIKKIYRNVTK